MARHLPPLTKLRDEAHCLSRSTGPHPRRRGPKRKYDGKVHFHDLRRCADLGTREARAPVQLYPALVWPVALKPKLRGVVLGKRQGPHQPRYRVWASSALESDGRRLGEVSVARFPIAVLLRASPQFPGRADCQARAEAARALHFTAARATLTRARAEGLRAGTAQSLHVFSLASWTQRHFTERLLGLVIEH